MKLSTIILAALFIVGCGTAYVTSDSRGRTGGGASTQSHRVERSDSKEYAVDSSKIRPVAAPAPPPPAAAPSAGRRYEINPGFAMSVIGDHTLAYLGEGGSGLAGGSAPPSTSSHVLSNTVKDDIQQQLFNVTMVFTIPLYAEVGKEIYPEFIIDPKRTEQEIKDIVKDKTGQVVTDKIDVSRTVTASIIAPSFDVFPANDITQGLSMSEPTKWHWTLVATKPGNQTVQLRVVAHIKIDGEKVERELETYSRNLDISIPPLAFSDIVYSFLKDHIEFVISGMIIPFVIWLYHAYKSRKKKKKTH